MKCLLISGIYRPEIGGPATYLPTLASVLIDQSNQVEIITLKNSSAPAQSEAWPVNYITRDQNLLLRFVKTVMLIIRKAKQAESIFSNGLIQETAVALVFIKRKSVAKVVDDPVWFRAVRNNESSLNIIEFNNSKLKFKHRLQRILIRWGLNRFDVITCPSIQLKNIIENWGVYKPIEFIPNGVSLVNDKSTDPNFDLVIVCRLISLKNVDRIIRASVKTNVSVAVVGSGPEEGNLRELAISLGAKVTFLGQLNKNEVNKILLRSKIYLNLSDHEGLSFSLLEAMSSGLPSIVSNIQGNTDVITNGLEGIVVDVKDENQLINAIKTLTSSQNIRLKYGLAAKSKIKSKYLQEIQVGKVINLLTTGIKQ
jgi:glycosyltransferase involved in cell wall biosynthesis